MLLNLYEVQHNKLYNTCIIHRQNVMVPLSWAISRALRYQPSDPKHYIAHQLLRWKYENVSQKEMHSARQFIISTMTMLDQKLVKNIFLVFLGRNIVAIIY